MSFSTNGYWAGLVTLRRTENPQNKVRFFEYPQQNANKPQYANR